MLTNVVQLPGTESASSWTMTTGFSMMASMTEKIPDAKIEPKNGIRIEIRIDSWFELPKNVLNTWKRKYLLNIERAVNNLDGWASIRARWVIM